MALKMGKFGVIIEVCQLVVLNDITRPQCLLSYYLKSSQVTYMYSEILILNMHYTSKKVTIRSQETFIVSSTQQKNFKKIMLKGKIAFTKIQKILGTSTHTVYRFSFDSDKFRDFAGLWYSRILKT